MNFPDQHYAIVNDLLKGKFILWNETHFDSLSKEVDFYAYFFEKSFDYELVVRKEFAYLISKKTSEEFSKKFTVFLSVLCYEWNLEGKDIHEQIEHGSFSVFEIQKLVESSTYNEIFRFIKLKEQDIEKFIFNDLSQRNIIKMDSTKENFEFTKAVELFFEFAQEIAKTKLATDKQ
jgi:hypothetical protein